MERMEVEPSGAGVALRRSNSAPLLAGPPGSPPREQPPGPQRSRRGSACLDSGLVASAAGAPRGLPAVGPGPGPPPPPGATRFSLARQAEAAMEALPRGLPPASNRAPPAGLPGSSPRPGAVSGFPSCHAAVTPSSWHPLRSPTAPSTRSPSVLETLKRKGGLEADSPPKKLFVAGVPLTPPPP